MRTFDFNLPDQKGKVHKLSDYHGKWLVLYFYPKDDTPGCTKEACTFRDKISEFKKRGIEVVGVSKDSVASHKKFSEKYHLNFTILSDPDHLVIEKYGAWGKKKFMGREFMGTMRNTVVISPDGEFVKEYKAVDPLTSADTIIKDLDLLKS